MEALNGTIDPACLKGRPLAIDMLNQLDTFGYCLYFMLTLMSCISLLVYLEQCAYIYKKLPYPKKTLVIWVNGAAPVISTMSCLAMWIPRAFMITDLTSNSYFAVVIYKILLLLIEELGGSNAFLEKFSGKPFWISTGPCCCCCPCLPDVPMSRRMLFLLKLGSLQYAILKTVFTVLSIVLWTNGNYDPANLGIYGITLWISLFVGVLTIISLWPVAIVFMNMNRYLRPLKIIPKYAMYQLTLVLSQLQTSIVNIVALYGNIACAPPLSSQARGTMLNQQILIMEMFIITLVNRFLYRRTYEAVETHDSEEDTTALPEATLMEHDV
ncbi:organic solute transporter subunit alpha isoform X1 [Oreochromis niloticus]|uniref:Organic solute transporter subunit alpha n=1 Tax=Oreochromis niloticus TaxID=8128 RepID=I3JC37_ORENI|nr:organic solute transporter subunit alpha isoform X1 [Oreochromis niloticus]CAI5643696.1 unnamed protein product [Mustela putorius furo]